MSTREKYQSAEDGGLMARKGQKYRIVGNILVFTGYFIGLAYLLMLYLMAFSLAEGMFVFWEVLVLPSWPWLLAAFLSISAGCTLIVIDARLRKRVQQPNPEPEAARMELAPPELHAPVEQPVDI